MAFLETTLSVSECLEILREQVQLKGRFAARTSPVAGSLNGCKLVLVATSDFYSKRMHAQLIACGEGTRIEYEWRTPLWTLNPLRFVFGSHDSGENEIMRFLLTWLKARRVDPRDTEE
jgi:hypothetical protein